MLNRETGDKSGTRPRSSNQESQTESRLESLLLQKTDETIWQSMSVSGAAYIVRRTGAANQTDYRQYAS